MAENIVVAMSGGVDSSVAAALLKQRGYNVIGIGLQLMHEREVSRVAGSYCGIHHIEDARRAAQQLSIPFYALDYRQLFKEAVVDGWVESYLNGETPNPCIACNKKIKFEVLLDFCKGVDAALVATGHYARVIFNRHERRYVLKKGFDESKDQSYFLYALSQEQLAHTCFPLGEMNKDEVRALAAEIGLKVHDKRESQDICFVGDGGYGAFLREHAGGRIESGAVLDVDGKVVGEHEGIAFYTVGQRRGVGISGPQRMYISDIDAASNTITVTASRDDLKQNSILLDKVNYPSSKSHERPLEVFARTRYRGEEKPALLLPLSGGKAILEWHEAQEAPAPGQAVVLYRGDEVVAGGTARRSLS